MPTTLETDTSQWPEIWRSAYKILEGRIPSHKLKTWIDPVEFAGVTISPNGKSEILLHVISDFCVDWITTHYLLDFEAAFSQVLGTPCFISVKVKESQLPLSVQAPVVTHAQLEKSVQASNHVLKTASPQTSYKPKNHRSLENSYTFSNFIVGNSNQFAHASAYAVAEQPGRQYNPLFIYSPPGLGKTHLLHAIGNHILQKNPDVRICYISAEEFVNEMIEAIQRNKTTEFRQQYREGYDVFLIDDIQFIAEKTKSEEEFFHTFNTLYFSKKQIVMTSDRPPKEIKVEERIRTRLEGGLVTDITAPDIETRIAILKSKAEKEDIYLPDEVATFLATHIKSNVRELEGALIKLQAQSSLTGAEISLEMAKQSLKITDAEEGQFYTVESLQGTVAKYYQIRISDLKSSSRAQKVAYPRQLAMYLCKKYTQLTLKEIGAYFGGKDHSTVSHAIQKFESGLENDPEVKSSIEAIQGLL